MQELDKENIKKEWSRVNKNEITDRMCVKIKEYTPAQKRKIKYVYRPRTIKTTFTSYLKRAEQKNISFELSLEEFTLIRNAMCTYCGGTGGTIDRIDSSIGYTIKNSAPCCRTCNTMKCTLSEDDFKIHIMQIVNHFIKKSNDFKGQKDT